LLDLLNVRFLLTEPRSRLSEKWKRLYTGPDGELYENPAVQPRFFGPAGVAVSSREDRPGRYTVRVQSPARVLISSSVPAMPGWRLRQNGRRLMRERLNGVFLAFFAERGESKVIVDYQPTAWGSSIGLLGLGICGLGTLIWRPRC
jgi:hypothetical protein